MKWMSYPENILLSSHSGIQGVDRKNETDIPLVWLLGDNVPYDHDNISHLEVKMIREMVAGTPLFYQGRIVMQNTR